jgi:hypothetical protein
MIFLLLIIIKIIIFITQIIIFSILILLIIIKIIIFTIEIIIFIILIIILNLSGLGFYSNNFFYKNLLTIITTILIIIIIYIFFIFLLCKACRPSRTSLQPSGVYRPQAQVRKDPSVRACRFARLGLQEVMIFPLICFHN